MLTTSTGDIINDGHLRCVPILQLECPGEGFLRIPLTKSVLHLLMSEGLHVILYICSQLFHFHLNK